MHMNDMTSKR